jgi:hypothetical protein
MMDSNDERELREALKRSFARFAADELLNEYDRDLLRRAFPGNDEVENVSFAAQNDLDAYRE